MPTSRADETLPDRIAVIGLGYIGLPTATIFATHGLEVIGVDVKQSTVDSVNRGKVPFVEPDLEYAVAGAVSHGRLSAAIETPPADAYIVAVPTPFNDDYTADLSFIEAAARGIAPQLKGDELIILESTSPPNATQRMADQIIEVRPDLTLEPGTAETIHIAHCPERVLPGRVMVEMVTNDRIVGGLTIEAAERARDLYKTFCQGDIHITNAVTAEMAKLVENSYRDVNIAFANELSVISEKLNIDVWELISLANHHPRVNILQPGPGVGGHCIAVDPWFIVSSAPEESKLIRQARLTNDAKPEHVISKVVEAAAMLDAPRIAALGLTFKADIDDLRGSPARKIVTRLADVLPQAQISAVEPHIEALPPELEALESVRLTPLDVAVEEADLVLVLVDHEEFKSFDVRSLDGKTLIDTRGIWPVRQHDKQNAK
ncbi:UDP-N-acetyl-D-mannosamine dehydrogenase [Arthrobacter monumenti]